MTTSRWFDVDKDGFSKLVAEQKAQAMIEVAFSNTLDQNVQVVEITLVPEGSEKDLWALTVIDDDPDGFSDLSHAYTVFAESSKKTVATKRGRFNLGEKLLLSLCREARITSTTGTVNFRSDGTRTQGKTAREAGTEVFALLTLTKKEVAAFEKLVRMVLIPRKVTITYNGTELAHREMIASIEAKGLPTVIGPELRPSNRNTTIDLYEVLDGEESTIYELGIPVVVSGGLPGHVSVNQKVPLSFARDNVQPAYLREIRRLVLDNRAGDITDEDANSTWVKDALAVASPEAVRAVVNKRFGDNAVAFDPSDLEANKLATAAGMTVVGGRTFGKDEWAAVRNAGVLPRAGSVTPSNASVELGASEKPTWPEDKWTPNQRAIVEYTKRLAKALLGQDIEVTLHNDVTLGADAFYGGHRLGYNIGCLGKSWFENPDEIEVDALIIHELAHEFCGDHLSRDYYHALCKLGAQLKLHSDIRLEV